MKKLYLQDIIKLINMKRTLAFLIHIFFGLISGLIMCLILDVNIWKGILIILSSIITITLIDIFVMILNYVLHGNAKAK